MLPPFTPSGNLPGGSHEATWEEIVERFGATPHRAILIEGLRRAIEALWAAGCRRVYLNGSFVTAKERPGDFDGCWEIAGVDWDRLDPVLRDLRAPRTAQKLAYGGELFPAHYPADLRGTRFIDFFQRDRDGNPKGIVAIDLEGL